MASSRPFSGSVRPFSGSVRKGQVAMLCHLCETDPKLKWKCLECGLLMCQQCKDKVHPKFQTTEEHIIIDIKDISKHKKYSEPNLTKIKCKVHSGQNCCLYCKTCESLVCQTCVNKIHTKHEFTEITKSYRTKFLELEDEQKETGKEIHTLILNEQKLKQIKSSEQSNYDKVKQEILDYDKALKKEIRKHTEKLLKELDKKWETVSNIISSETKRIKEQKQQIHEKQKEINLLLQVDNAKDVFSVTSSMIKSGKENVQSLNMAIAGVPSFIHGDKTKILQIVGKLDGDTIQINSDLQIKGMFETELPLVTSIVPCPDGGIWICDFCSNIVQKVIPQGDNLSITSNIDIGVYKAALLPCGNLLLSVFGLSNLKLIPSGATDIKNSVYTVSQLQPTCAHVTCDNKVIVGAVDSFDIPATGPRQIIVMDQSGHHDKVFQYDRHNKPLFTFPFCIASNSRGNIAVVDQVSDFYNDCIGRVVVLDKEGEVINIYEGDPINNLFDNYCPFIPRGITTTPSENFVVADVASCTLQILNSEGEIITFYNIEDMEIILPNSLSFSSTGQLYIGCGFYTGLEKTEILYVTDNFLF